MMMVKSKCERVSRYLLPTVRGLIAKSLVEEYGFTQSRVAKRLGITQAAVSFYVSSKRGNKLKDKIPSNKDAMDMIKALAKKMASSSSTEKIDLCDICKMLASYV
ncbi:MAG: transcriptional regulator [Nitrososphaeria archaeon]